MALYNNGFPMAYPQYYQPYQQYQQPVQQPQQAPSSRMVDVYPAASEQVVLDFPAQNGTTTLFIANDDSFIAIKEVSVTGQTKISTYIKRPPAPPEKPVDLSRYVTRDELDTRLAALTPKRTTRKETEAE